MPLPITSAEDSFPSPQEFLDEVASTFPQLLPYIPSFKFLLYDGKNQVIKFSTIPSPKYVLQVEINRGIVNAQIQDTENANTTYNSWNHSSLGAALRILRQRVNETMQAFAHTVV